MTTGGGQKSHTTANWLTKLTTEWKRFGWHIVGLLWTLKSLINHRLVKTYSQQHKTSGGQTLGELSNISIVRYTYVSEYGETTHHDFEPRSVQTNIKIQPIDKTSVHVTIPNSLHSYCQHLTIFRNYANRMLPCRSLDNWTTLMHMNPFSNKPRSILRITTWMKSQRDRTCIYI